MGRKQCVHLILLPKDKSLKTSFCQILFWFNCWCELMFHTGSVSARYVNRMSPAVILGDILFAEVTRSHFVNTIKPRDTTRLADQHFFGGVAVFTCCNVWSSHPHKFRSTNELISHWFQLLVFPWEHRLRQCCFTRYLYLSLSLSNSTFAANYPCPDSVKELLGLFSKPSLPVITSSSVSPLSAESTSDWHKK